MQPGTWESLTLRISNQGARIPNGSLLQLATSMPFRRDGDTLIEGRQLLFLARNLKHSRHVSDVAVEVKGGVSGRRYRANSGAA